MYTNLRLLPVVLVDSLVDSLVVLLDNFPRDNLLPVDLHMVDLGADLGDRRLVEADLGDRRLVDHTQVVALCQN